ncbi:hypothetical protein LOTGIDRAFT_154861 [Lottia gigantea]|uniref:Uncharacterized protein n=1 Tax=Lottia gigantea TaxID=225164 RepID=V3Z408_LOTGI|nr:hypothetical protein LOTGIDRAFT_154861 [Lottia gigantea]ESO85368.1 hypothetical protein LOTGIDRAFT_154861 [Lottia gigantea]
MVYEWMKDVSVDVPNKTPDKRRNTQRTDNKVIAAKEFLGKLPNLPSHYCRATSNKKYLEPIFTTFADLYRVYKQYCTTEGVGIVCKKAFKSCFDDLNLSLSRPKKDQCDICCGFEAGNISEIDYNNHINLKNEARMKIPMTKHELKMTIVLKS